LRRRATLAKVMLGEPILIGRDAGGAPFVLRDPCPHRGMPLSAGRFDGREVECCYHGWRFDTGGRCTSIPSLVPGRAFTSEHIRTRSYPVRVRICSDVKARPGTSDGIEVHLPPVSKRQP